MKLDDEKEEVSGCDAFNMAAALVISHETLAYKTWYVFILILDGYTFFMYTYFSGYRYSWNRAIWIPFEAIYLLNLILNFFVNYRD